MPIPLLLVTAVALGCITAIGCSLVLVETFGFVLAQFFGPPF